MGARIRYPDLLDTIRETVTNLERFLMNLEAEGIGGREELSLTLGNYLRDATVTEHNPTLISNLGGVLSTVIRRIKIGDTKSISILRKTLSSFIERYITESLSGLAKSCEAALSGSRSVLLIPPGRLAEECVRIWSYREEAREIYVLRHVQVEESPVRIGSIKTTPLLPSSLSTAEDRVDAVVTEVSSVIPGQVLAPPVSAGAISFSKHVNNAYAIGVTLSIAVKITGRPGEAIMLRSIAEVPQAWGEFITVTTQDIVNLDLLDKLVLGSHVVEGPPNKLFSMSRRIAMSVMKDLTNTILSAVVVEQSAKE